ncbi:ABC transporter ATP-binding protein [Microbacterium sp.]|jgi:ABC-type glutathione transport system ATPase component|uniref:ABC transporter ATP-binding protein n=1 Tax=Microbacterium sp. TaxID=51671 RepID=UPI002CFE967D|nr:ATP-binding cassette domain-containing protein [Microbacterium sp.]HWL78652.1 ATP-binding cassette domain-containing protein [Microbacterium sp.]
MLEALEVTKVFRGRHSTAPVVAVDDVTVRARPGQFVAIVGESGSGKSTLARILLDLIPISSGRVELDGADLKTMDAAARRAYRRAVQAVLQDPAGSLNPRKRVDRTIGEVIRLHGMASGRGVRDKTVEVLELVGLSPADRYLDRFPHELSGGQRQRVLIARALALDPRIIIADEAVSALDASVKAGVLRVMVDLKDRLGVGFVFITHDLPVVQKVADYVYVMRNGKVVEEGEKDAVFEHPEHPYTRMLLASAPVLA